MEQNFSGVMTNITARISEGCAGAETIPGIVSNETRVGLSDFNRQYSHVHGYIAVAVCLFGVLSNSANIIVLTRKNMASSTNTLLLWLAVCDLLKMLDYLLFAIHFYVMEPGDPTGPAFPTRDYSWICFLLFHASFSIVCHGISIWLTIALAIFRYIYICKPTSGVFYCSQERARFVVFIVVVLTTVICAPNYAVNSYNVAWKNTTSSNLSASVNTTAFLYYYPIQRTSNQAEKINQQINYWIQAIFVKLVPCVMLTTLTLLLVAAMHRAYRKRLKLKSQGRKAESDRTGEHNRITRMLLAVVILFTLTELPQGILTLMNIFVNCFTEVVYDKLGDLVDIMALTNNSVNFILYCTMSTQFRTTFASIFCPHRPVESKWLKLRIVKSQKEDKLVTEVSEPKSSRGNNNGHIAPKCTPPDPPEGEHSQAADQPSDDVQQTDLHGSVEKVPLTVECNNGTTTHTRGYYPDQSHV